MHDDNHAPPAGDRAWLRAVLDPRWSVLAVVAAVAAFCFVVSYSHIFDLGGAHAQHGAADRLLPLSIDGLIVAATMVLLIQAAWHITPTGLARWLPRGTLWAGIAATVLANVAYGLPHGWESAVISGWPGAAFVAAVEIGVVVFRLSPQTESQNENPAVVVPAEPVVPATAHQAAAMAYAASVAGGNALPARQLMVRYGIKRGEADRIVKGSPAAVTAALTPEGGAAGYEGREVESPARLPATLNGRGHDG